MAKIFISHSSRNNNRAVEVRDWLVKNGWDDVFLDLDPERGIAAGQRWKEELHRAANRCQLVLALVSSEWLASGWCKAETDAARLLGKKIIYVLIGIDKSAVPQEMSEEQWVDLVGDPDGYKRLRQGLRRAGLDPSSFELEPGRRPYPGFAFFEEKDAAIYFGRDAQIVRGVDKIRSLSRAGVDRMLIILGASGSGKSSFLRAGLWPRLKRDDQSWLPLPAIRPERAVLSGKFGLAKALEQVIGDLQFASLFRERGLPCSRGDILEFVQHDQSGLKRIFVTLREIGGRRGSIGESAQQPTIVISIDQGEELFNEDGRDEARRFVELIASVLKTDPLTFALLAMRSDSFPLLQAEPELATLSKDAFMLDAMLEGSYRAVIEGPARLCEPKPLKIDPLLTDALLEDISGQDALPLLAFTLAHLFDQYAAEGELSLAHYEKIGRLKGVIDATIKGVFADGVANGELPKDPNSQLRLARAVFIPGLAQVNTAGHFVRRVARRDEIPVEGRPLADRFAERRLLIKDRRGGSEVIEVAHEALLRQPPFSDWLAEDREFLVWRARLAEARAAFDANQRGLLIGRELEIARSWMQTRAQEEIAPAERSFISDSVAEDSRRREEAAAQERRFQAAEKEEQERRIRDAEKIAAARKRTTGVALALSVIAMLIAGTALWQYAVATKATKIATMREWAAQARAEAGTPHGLLLGLNSISLAKQIGAAPPIDSIQLLNDLLRRTGGLPLHHAGPVAAVEFSPDNRLFASASGGDIFIRNIQAPNDPPKTLSGSAQVRKIAFGPNGLLVAIGDDRDARVYKFDGSDPVSNVRTLSGHTAPLRDLAFSPNGVWLATSGDDGTVRLWNMAASNPDAPNVVLRLGNKPVFSVAFSPDGQLLATGDHSGVRLWNVQDTSADPMTVYRNEDENVDILKVAFSLDGQWLVVGASENYQVLIFHTPFDAPPRSFHVNQWVGNVAFSPDKRWLVVPDHYDALVMDLNKADPTSEPTILRGHKDAIADMEFSPDGRWFATGSADHTVQLWNVVDRFSGPEVLKGHEGPISDIAFSGDSRWLATAGDDGTARLWNVSSPFGEPLSLLSALEPTKLHTWNWRATPQPAVLQILGEELGLGAGRVFSQDGNWLATFSNPVDVIHLWNLKTSPATKIDLSHPGAATPAFSPDGRWLATGGWDEPNIKLWDLTSPDPKIAPIVLNGHNGPIRSLAFSANGHVLVSGAEDTLALVWDVTTPSAKPRVLAGGAGTSIVRTVAISPNGRYVLTGSWEPDYAARLWDLSLADPASKLVKLSFKDRVFDTAFSPDGRWAAAGSWDHTIQLLDLTKPNASPFLLRGHTARTLSIAFSPDSQWLATGNEDRTVRLWSLSVDDPSTSSIKLIAAAGLGVSFNPTSQIVALSQTEYRSNPFSPDGSSFASADASDQLYHVRLDDLIALACRIAGRNLTTDEVLSSHRSPYVLDTNVCSDAPATPAIHGQ